MINWILVLNFKKLKLMKTKVIMAMLLVLITVACKKKNLTIENDLIGSWQLVKEISGTGNGFDKEKRKYKNGYILTFNNDSTYFFSNTTNISLINSINKKFSIEGSKIRFKREWSYVENGVTYNDLYDYTEEIEFTNKRMELLSIVTCDEGCKYIYKKVKTVDQDN